jgi:type I restriction enzyme R subunit
LEEYPCPPTTTKLKNACGTQLTNCALTQPDPQLSRKEQEGVKEVARELLDTLKAERLVLDWRKNQQTRAGVQLEIEKILDKLPENYDAELYKLKCQIVYQHVYDSYYGDGRSIYTSLVA